MEIQLNSAYKPARETKARYRVIYGGAGSGKSRFVGQETIINMLIDSNFKYLVVRKTSRSIRESVYAELESLINSYNLHKYFRINKTEMSFECINGSKLITSGLDNVEKLKSIQGVNRIWVEEASEISENDFTQLDLRMRGKNNLNYQMTVTFNPISELHWLKKKFFDVGMQDCFILKTTYKDNSFLDERYIKTLTELKEIDYQYYKIYCLGEWGSLGNLIYNNWEKQDLSKIKDTFDNHFNGLDWGFSDDPTAIIRVHLDSKHKTLYVVDEIYQRELHTDQIANILKDKIGNEYITCDSSEPRSISDLKRHGIKAKGAKKGKGSIEHGIKYLQGLKIVVDNVCINTIKELTSYKWREDKDGNVIANPVDRNNHLLDALRYGLEDEMISKDKWGW